MLFLALLPFSLFGLLVLLALIEGFGQGLARCGYALGRLLFQTVPGRCFIAAVAWMTLVEPYLR